MQGSSIGRFLEQIQTIFVRSCHLLLILQTAQIRSEPHPHTHSCEPCGTSHHEIPAMALEVHVQVPYWQLLRGAASMVTDYSEHPG